MSRQKKVVNTDESVEEFKAQLFTLSFVPIDRQKIMCAGKTLKDDEWNIPLKNVSCLIFFCLVIHSLFVYYHLSTYFLSILGCCNTFARNN